MDKLWLVLAGRTRKFTDVRNQPSATLAIMGVENPDYGLYLVRRCPQSHDHIALTPLWPRPRCRRYDAADGAGGALLRQDDYERQSTLAVSEAPGEIYQASYGLSSSVACQSARDAAKSIWREHLRGKTCHKSAVDLTLDSLYNPATCRC